MRAVLGSALRLRVSVLSLSVLVGGRTPMPRKLSVDPARITDVRQSRARCRSIICRSVSPRARAVSTNSFSRSESTCPRTSRAIPGHPTSPSATKTCSSAGSFAPCYWPARTTDITRIANGMSGKANITSVRRISTPSTYFPGASPFAPTFRRRQISRTSARTTDAGTAGQCASK